MHSGLYSLAYCVLCSGAGLDSLHNSVRSLVVPATFLDAPQSPAHT